MGTDYDMEKNTQLLGLINILGDDYTNIYLVNRKTQQIEIYRYRNQDVDVKKELYKEKPYESAMTSYIENKVVPEDRRKMSKETNLATVCEPDASGVRARGIAEAALKRLSILP